MRLENHLDQRVFEFLTRYGATPAWLVRQSLHCRTQLLFDSLRRLRAHGLVERGPGIGLARDHRQRKVTLYSAGRTMGTGQPYDPGQGQAFVWLTPG